jgi:hypothetical protein
MAERPSNNPDVGKTAYQLLGSKDPYTQAGAKALVDIGRSTWTLVEWGSRFCRLWKSPAQDRSVGTNMTGELYGEG